MDLSKKIKEYRKLRGLTQNELGVLCGFPTKSADSRIREFESGKTCPKQEILQKIADSLNVSILDLLDIKLDRPADLLQVLFNLEEQYGVTPIETDEYNTYLSITKQPFNELVHIWSVFREMYSSDNMTSDDYKEIKLILLNYANDWWADTHSKPDTEYIVFDKHLKNKRRNKGNT